MRGLWAQLRFFEICSPGFFVYFRDSGHSRSFHKICSPGVFGILGIDDSYRGIVLLFTRDARRTIIGDCLMVPNITRIREKTGVTLFWLSAPVPKSRKSRGNKSEKSVVVPKRPKSARYSRDSGSLKGEQFIQNCRLCPTAGLKANPTYVCPRSGGNETL